MDMATEEPDDKKVCGTIWKRRDFDVFQPTSHTSAYVLERLPQ